MTPLPDAVQKIMAEPESGEVVQMILGVTDLSFDQASERLREIGADGIEDLPSSYISAAVPEEEVEVLVNKDWITHVEIQEEYTIFQEGNSDSRSVLTQ